MKYLVYLTLILYFGLFNACQNAPREAIPSPSEEIKSPYDWMYSQRAYPNNHIDMKAYWEAMEQTLAAKNAVSTRENGNWELVGPVNTGGRITDVVLHPQDTNIIYAGASVGGIWKSEDGGEAWSPIFENKGVLTIGDLAISTQNPDVLYVGTGEANGSATSGAFFGNGVYRTTNGGETWVHKGLENSQHIGRIAINPQNLNNVFVAVAGALYEKNNDRGLYRTNDGGDTWEQVLFISDSTSMIDVAFHPTVPNWVYAVSWERLRYPWQRSYGGMTSGIWRSKNGGDTWEQLTNGLPPNSPETGRIGIHFSQSESNIAYAVYTTNPITNVFDGIYKTVDSGDSWTRVDNDDSMEGVFSSFGWFFGNIRVDPNDPERIYVLGVPLVRSIDGGNDFFNIAPDNHVDNHGLAIHPSNSDYMVSGNDGGIYITKNGGEDWNHVESLPITQFYNAEIDYLNPDRFYGGTQDNGTNRTLTGDADNWQRILGGDGFQVMVSPENSNVIYAEYQFGVLFRSYNNANQMDFIFNGFGDDRNNWNTPIAMDQDNPTIIYYGSQYLYQSIDEGDNWERISPDLTDGQHPSGSRSFGTLSTIEIAPSNSDVIYVGTDDGNVQVTFDRGLNWENISAGLPDRYVTKVKPDPFDENLVFVTLSGYRYGEYQPHVLRSFDGGQNWEDISANLPEIPINDIIIDPDFEDTYYIANDLGVWVTADGGNYWDVLEPTLPTTVVNDLDFHPDSRMLVAATFGRSMHKIDLQDFVPTETEKLTDSYQLIAAPNPVKDFFQIKLQLPEVTEATLELFSISGQKISLISAGVFQKGEQVIDANLSGLPPGNYFIRWTSNKKILCRKVIKM